jgi:hypothetical protein
MFVLLRFLFGLYWIGIDLIDGENTVFMAAFALSCYYC